MTKDTLIRFDKVSKVYDNGHRAVDEISFDLYPGEFITILGSSGSGKTTTLKMINRLIEPSSGQIFINDQESKMQDEIALRRQIGYVVQQIGLFPHMTVAENIGTVPRLLGWEKTEITKRVDDLLHLIGLTPDDYRNRYPRQLSGGQQQRIGVARALAANPNIMLLDEPFGAIDAISRNSMQDELLRIHRELGDKTFVLITHDLVEAFRMGTRVMIMDQGKICQFDRPEKIIANPQGEFVENLLATAKSQLSIWENRL